MDLFLIMDGVHRSVAAREVGLPGVLAIVEIDGKSLGTRLVRIEQLISPKDAISRWDRGHDMLPFIDTLRTTEGRSKLQPIFVQPISAERAKRFTPLDDVAIHDYESEEMP